MVAGKEKTLAILVGGGPAPGINGVVASVVDEAAKRGWRVVGIVGGFRHLMEGNPRLRLLAHDDVAPFAARGGSLLKTSRDNPFKPGFEDRWRRVTDTLRTIDVDHLVTIGGEGTMAASASLARETGIRVAHVPKTIDNDLPLPAHLDTFGFQTARHVGTELVHNLIEDARSTERWYVVVTMGREAGHLALGIGKAAGAAVTVIPEEFGERVITFEAVCDVVEGSILKRRARGTEHGVAVLAEGLAARLDLEGAVAREEYKGMAPTEVPLAFLVRDELRRRFREAGVPVTVMAKEIGYELRCADPVAADVAYARDLGFAAVRFLAEGGSGAVVTVDGGRMAPLPFEDVLDPATGRSRVRFVDTRSEAYRVALESQERLRADDVKDAARVRRLAEVARTTPEAFRERFARVAGTAPPKTTP